MYLAPAQPATGRQDGTMLVLPKKLHREQPRQVEAGPFSTRSDTGGTPGQARDAGAANATSRTERSGQRGMPAQGLGCLIKFHREQSRQVKVRRFSTRIGSGDTLAGAAGRTAFMKYAG